MASGIKSVGPYPTLLLFPLGLQIFETTHLSVACQQAWDAFRWVLLIYLHFCPSGEKKSQHYVFTC